MAEERAWTPDEIRGRLSESTAWLERGILAVYERQTAAEKAAKVTRDSNGIGFSAFDAEFLSSLAEWLRSGRHLTEKQAAHGRRKMLKYSGQLARIANGAA